MFYQHFRRWIYLLNDKIRLVLLLSCQQLSLRVPLIHHLFGNGDLPLDKRIEEAISVHFDFVAVNPDLPRFLINEVLPYKNRCAKIASYFHLFNSFQREVDEAAARGEVESFNVLLLFQSILSLNIFPSLMANIIENLLSDNMQSIEMLLAQRKTENIELIMRRIKKE